MAKARKTNALSISGKGDGKRHQGAGTSDQSWGGMALRAEARGERRKKKRGRRGMAQGFRL